METVMKTNMKTGEVHCPRCQESEIWRITEGNWMCDYCNLVWRKGEDIKEKK